MKKTHEYNTNFKKEYKKLKYYAYIDYFKEKFQGTIPFYLRNFDVFYNPDFTEKEWNYFTQRITAKLENKELPIIKTQKIKEFEAWVARL